MKQPSPTICWRGPVRTALFFVLICGMAVPGRIWAHGSMQDPVSRVYRIFLDNPEAPKNDSARAALAVNGTQPFYDWHEVSRNVPDYNWQAAVPDGQLASGGRAKYAGIDLVRSDWPATLLQPGPYHFVYHAHVPHDPSFFRAFITKEGWDPDTPLAWGDLEPLPGAENAVRDGNYYEWDGVLPARTGRHVIYVVWQRIDPAGEVFFSASDVVFGADNGTGGGEVTPGTDYEPVPGEPSGPCGNALHECQCSKGDVAVAFQVTSSWSGGFVASITITNHGSAAINGWELSFDLPRDLVNHWSAVLKSAAAGRYTFGHEAWTATIPAGGSVTFGLQVDGTSDASPTAIQFNGNAVGGDGGTTPGGDPGDEEEETPSVPGPGEEVTVVPSERRIVAYFPSWGIYQKGYEVADLPAGKLTHVIHAFARISAAGEIEIIDPWADIERALGPDTWETPVRGHFGAYARLKAAHPHLRVLIAVGGWFDSGRFSTVAATPAARQKFAASVRSFVVRYGFDGVDLDWEYPVVATDVNSNVRPEDSTNYALLAAAIRAEFDAQSAVDGRRYEITAAVPAGYDKFERIDLAALGAQLDFLNLMTYDFHGRWIPNQTGHNAPLFRSAGDPNARYNTDEAVKGYLAAGVPAAKIVLGVPAYGYGWTGVTNPTPFSSATGLGPGTLPTIEPGFYDYRTVAALVQADPSAEKWDEAAQASYFYNGNLWIGYDSPRALRRKLEYVGDMGLGGVMFWEASTDVRNADDPLSLLNIANRVLAAPSTWAEWRQLRFTAGHRADEGISGTAADPDGDGVPNLMEYAIGSDPWVPSRRPVDLRLDPSTHRMILRVEKSPYADDVDYVVEALGGPDGNLAWSTLHTTVLNDNRALIEVADNIAPDDAPWRWMRLRVNLR